MSFKEEIRKKFREASKTEKFKILLKGWDDNIPNKGYKELPSNFYNSEEWAKVRIIILKRDNYKCVHCGEPANHVDHLNSAKFYPKMALVHDNLISSCEPCHKKRQPRGKWK